MKSFTTDKHASSRDRRRTRSRPNVGPIHLKRYGQVKALRAHRERLAQAAQDTLRSLGEAHQEQSGIVAGSKDLTLDLSASLSNTRQTSSFYPHHSSFLAGWATGPSLSLRGELLTDSGTQALIHRIHPPIPTQVEFVTSSALAAARHLLPATGPVGLLNAASPKKPGGACLNGGSNQDECLARQTTIYDSLRNTEAGSSFYAEHRVESDGSGFHDHSMLYTPQVVVFKDDRGRRVVPYSVDVLSCVPVNASTVRAKFNIDVQHCNNGIRHVMKERMGRILCLFEERGVRSLVLGAFGVGQSCNSPDMIGEIWADLLHVRGARFKDSFDKVVFALPGRHRVSFENGFNSRILESEILQSMADDTAE